MSPSTAWPSAGRGAIAIFVKTPGLSPVKTRLAQTIGREAAEEFHRRSAQAVEAVVRSIAREYNLVPYWAVAEEGGQLHPLWQAFATLPQGDGGLGERLARVYGRLIERHVYVLFLGADSPQISAAVLERALRALAGPARSFVLGCSRDGGFYLFGGAVPLPQRVWLAVPYSHPQTAEELSRRLEEFGPVAELPVLCDVDTADDLPQLLRELQALPQPLPEQLEIATWIEQTLGASR